MTKRVALIVNPARAHGDRVREELFRRVGDAGWPQPLVYRTTVSSPGADQARQALAEGADLVLVTGGDGTVRAVAEQLVGTEAELGIIPTGTGNLLARNLDLQPWRVRENVITALHGTTRRMDVGIAAVRTPWESQSWSAGTPFFVMAGIGRDAEAVRRTSPRLKRRLGWMAYLESGSRHMLATPVRMRATIDETTRDIDTWTLLFGNCPRIPGGITVFPRARWDDGLLETLEVPLDSPLDWAGVAAKGLLGLDRDVRALHYGRARSAHVVPDRPMPVQLDGDVIPAVTELRITLRAQALRVRTPPPRGSR